MSPKSLISYLPGYSNFDWKSEQFNLALKSAIAIILATCIALLLHVAEPFWAGISAFVIIQAKVGSTFHRGILRAIGTLIGAFCGILVVKFFSSSSFYLIIALFLITAFGLYESCKSANPYAWILGVATFLMVAEYAFINPDLVIHVAFYRSFEVIIGIFSAWFINLFIFRSHAKELFAANLIKNLDELKRLITFAISDCQNGYFNSDKFRKEYKNFVVLQDAKISLAPSTRLESLFSLKKYYRIVKMYEALKVTGELLLSIYDRQNLSPVQPGENGLKQEWEKVEQDLLIFLSQIELFFQEKVSQQALKDAFLTAQESLACLREKQPLAWQNVSSGKSYESETLFHKLYFALHTALLVLDDALIEKHPRDLLQPQSKKPISKKIMASLTANKLLMQYGIKGALAVLSVPLIWSYFALPGLNQIAVSVIAVLQIDINSTQKKGWLRILGCVVGGAIALLALGLDINNLAIFLSVIFLVCFGLAYLHHGKNDRSYLGTQATVAFLMAFVVGLGPTTVLGPSIERLCGIIMGVIMVVLVMQTLWPITEEKLRRHYLARIRYSFDLISEEIIHLLSSRHYAKRQATNQIHGQFVIVRNDILEIAKLPTNGQCNFNLLRHCYHDLYVMFILVKIFNTEMQKSSEFTNLLEEAKKIFTLFSVKNVCIGKNEMAETIAQLKKLTESLVATQVKKFEREDEVMASLTFIHYLQSLARNLPSLLNS